MSSDKRSPIVLSGVSGSGKSTIGKHLAPALGATFLEGDDYHPSSNIAKMRAGVPLTDEDRWPWLDKLGVAIRDHHATGRAVVAACSALRRSYRDRLSAAAGQELVFIHLNIDPKILAARVQARKHFMPPSLLESQLETLEPLAADEPGTVIDEMGTAFQTVEAVTRWLRRRAHDPAHGSGHEKGRSHRPLSG